MLTDDDGVVLELVMGGLHGRNGARERAFTGHGGRRESLAGPHPTPLK
jgi:hypothetical protein